MFAHLHFLVYRIIVVFLIILVIVFIIYLIVAGTIRMKMPFWRTQPVFHMYNLKYWLKPPGFINLEPPPVNKFVNLINNDLIMVEAIDTNVKDTSAKDTSAKDTSAKDTSANAIKIKQICDFIRDYYVIHPRADYKPSEDDIMAYLHCSNHPSSFNIYQEQRMVINDDKETVSVPSFIKEIVGVVSTRVLNVSLNKNKISFAVYYVDNLCVKPDYRKKGIPPQMIQTFYYNMSRINKKINAYMFKREGTLTAIVPLVYFDTHWFDIRQFTTDEIINPSMTLIAVGAEHLNVLIHFIKEQKKNLECTVLPDVSSLLNLIKLEKLLIYGILRHNELIAIYVFRPLALYHKRGSALLNQRGSALLNQRGSAPFKPPLEREGTSVEGEGAMVEAEGAVGKTVECITIFTSENNNDILITGFNMSLIKVKEKCQAVTLLLEETGHSSPVIKALALNSTVLRMFKSPTAFFLYNYACYSVRKEKAMLIY
jgi:hypothetical protein